MSCHLVQYLMGDDANATAVSSPDSVIHRVIALNIADVSDAEVAADWQLLANVRETETRDEFEGLVFAVRRLHARLTDEMTAKTAQGFGAALRNILVAAAQKPPAINITPELVAMMRYGPGPTRFWLRKFKIKKVPSRFDARLAQCAAVV